MAPTLRAPGQQDLLEWTPPQPVVTFDPAQVRGADLAAKLSRAVSVALHDCGMPRAEVAERMSAYLNQCITENMLNAYASGAREKHGISLPRFIALMAVTEDRRLLEFIAAMFGWAVIERRDLPMIELAAVHEQKAALKRREEALRRQLGGGR